MMRFLCALVLLLSSCAGLAQNRKPLRPCPATKQAILKARSESLEKLLDENAVISSDNGKRQSKADALATWKREQTGNKTVPASGDEDVLIRFLDGVAILNFVLPIHNVDLNTGVEFTSRYRESAVFGCDDGSWKIIFRSEIPIPNATRPADESARAHLDDYVGHYRFYQNGIKGDAYYTRQGDRLYERWGNQDPDEILPGGHDTFFVRYDGTVAQFVRDEKNKVVGVHYIQWDADYEAKRVE